jgi:hypothetical protein
MFQWMQVLTADKSEELEDNAVVTRNSEYKKYATEDGREMVEYHVDSYKQFQDECNLATCFGDYLSVRAGHDRPLLSLGHDEAIFKQYTLTKSAWVTPEGSTALVPKDESQGRMISAFQSRKFGFGMVMTDKDLQRVNETRREKKYTNETAAIAKRGSADKKNLLSSPFILEFECGVNFEGYWSCEHMVLQLEDCVDCMKVITLE